MIDNNISDCQHYLSYGVDCLMVMVILGTYACYSLYVSSNTYCSLYKRPLTPIRCLLLLFFTLLPLVVWYYEFNHNDTDVINSFVF